MNNSIDYIYQESPEQILFGTGPGSIEKKSDKGESNAYLKLFIEEGLIITILILSFIYYHLKNNVPLLFVVLISLHLVILIDTPLFILLVILGSIYNKFDNELIKPKIIIE